jgi:hypothetical protein
MNFPLCIIERGRVKALVTAVMLSIFLDPSTTLAQNSRAPIDLITQLLPVETIGECVSRVRSGFQKAGYGNIVDEPSSNGVKGVMPSGDFAGTISMANCSAVSNAFFVSIASSSSNESAATVQNNRLLAAIFQR